MARRSNKTAHVLNLLAGHDSQNSAEETAANESVPSASEASASEGAPEHEAARPSAKEEEKTGAQQPAKADAEPAPASAPVNTPVSPQNISVIDTTSTDPVAELIQQELSNQFESQLAAVSSDTAAKPESAEASAESPEEKEPAAADSTEEAQPTTDVSETAIPETSPEVRPTTDVAKTADPETSPDIQPAADVDETVIPETSPEVPPTIEVAETIASETPTETRPVSDAAETAVPEEPAAADVTDSPTPEPEPDFVYLNVMEEIVKDKIIYFMRQFDVCTCDRCKADTIALTMNGLTPKYIVTSPAAVAPLVSYYTNRLISDVTVEAIKACMIVKDNPRH